MTALIEMELKTGLEAVFLRLFRAMPPRRQRALVDALQRRHDGQPIDEALIEMLIEFGDTPAEARREVEAVLAAPSVNWRECLN